MKKTGRTLKALTIFGLLPEVRGGIALTSVGRLPMSGGRQHAYQGTFPVDEHLEIGQQKYALNGLLRDWEEIY